MQIKGFSSANEMQGSTFFQPVLEHNAAAIANCYTHAEGALFASLKKLLVKYTDWVAVGALDDVNDFIAARANTPESFEQAFQDSRQVARDLHRAVPNEVREGCFLVSLGPLKRAVEEQVKRVAEALVTQCRGSAQADRDAVAEFAERGRGLLQAQAGSLTEIGEARVQVR